MNDSSMKLVTGSEKQNTQYILNYIEVTEKPFILLQFTDNERVSSAITDEEQKRGCEIDVTFRSDNDPWDLSNRTMVNSRMESIMMYHCDGREEPAEEIILTNVEALLEQNGLRKTTQLLNIFKQKLADYNSSAVCFINTDDVSEKELDGLKPVFDTCEQA